jgi:hypothetical protein
MKALTTKVPSDLMEKIDDHAEQRNITRSHAARDLLYDGLEATTDTDTLTDRLTSALAAVAVIGYPTLAAHAGQPLTAAVWVALVACYVLFQPQIDAAIDRLPNPLNRL